MKIYKMLGPFDFYQEPSNKLDQTTGGGTDENDSKSMQDRFDMRRSGAMFRGEISQNTGKPEGRGIKIFPNGSVFEGNFQDGHTHGYGRGVTSRGEVF
jgi:hypothetical protein